MKEIEQLEDEELVLQYQQLKTTDSVSKDKKPMPTMKLRQYDEFTAHMEWIEDNKEQTWIQGHPEEALRQEEEFYSQYYNDFE
jgi:hypothetical protein